MKLSEELTWRGFINQTTFKHISEIDKPGVKFYWGVDPSANSMTIGNLAAAMLARHLIDAGHEATLLVGGATGRIGDPDGKADERNLKDEETIEKNVRGITSQYKKIFAGKDFRIVNNYDWFKDMNYINFLRIVGKNVPMSQMLGRDFIKKRLGEDGSGISYAEFSYSLIQGYDFLFQYQNYGTNLQICGADQWGNSVTGVDLIRRIEGGEANVLSMPLIINKATGKKFGKSEDGAVWLDPEQTSPYKFYQFWLNADDEGVIDYMKIYTLLSKEEIEATAAKHKLNPGARLAQKFLADEATKLVHGERRLNSVKRVTDVLFGAASFTTLSANDLEELAREIPVVAKEQSLVDILLETKVSSSKGDARRLISSGAISINGEKAVEDFIVKAVCLVKKGKNSFILVK